MKIQQKFYPSIEIDATEKDIVQLWQNGDVVQIERENLEQLIEILMKQLPMKYINNEDGD